MNFKNIILYISLLFFCGAFGQNSERGTLTGKVVFADEKPCETAVVLVKGTQRFAQTDEKGWFSLENLPLGEVILEIKPFDSETTQITLHIKQKTQHFDIKLRKNEGVSLSEVVVSSQSKPKTTKEQGYAMNIISTKEASLQNLQTIEVLNRSAGLKIRQSAGLGSDISFNLNGLTGNSVRVFIDGIPIRSYGRSFSVSSIPPSMIERIEVYKGVLPSELSEDALGGGINIILKKEYRNSLTSSYSYGSFNTHQWDLNSSFRNEKNGFVATLSSFHNYTDNNYKVWGDNVYVTDNTTGIINYVKAERFHDNYRSVGIKGNAGFINKRWADEIMLGFMFSEMQRDIQTGATMEVVYGNRKTAYNSRMGSLQYKKNNLLTKGLDASTFTTYSLTHRRVIDTIPNIYNWTGNIAKAYNGIDNAIWNKGGGEAGRETLAHNTELNLVNRSNIHYHITPLHSIGASFFLDKFSREIDDPLETKEARESMDKRLYNKHILSFNYDGGFFGKKLKYSIFYKKYYQGVKLTEFHINRGFGGGYTVSSTKHDRSIKDDGYGGTLSVSLGKVTFSLSAERAIRLPGITELLGNTSENIDPNISLRPENSRNYNFGIQLSNFHIGKNDIAAEVNLFVRDIHDMIRQGVPRNTADFYQFENLGKVISKGIDAEVRYNWDKKLFINLTGSYSDARFNLEKNEHGIKYFYYKSRLRNAPYLTGNAYAEYVFNGLLQDKSQLSINYNFNYTHDFFRDWENLGSANKIIIPKQPLHDIGISYIFPNKKITLALNAKNIFDRQVFDNYALQKPGRAIYGKLTLSLF